jgi:hypothetical protein
MSTALAFQKPAKSETRERAPSHIRCNHTFASLACILPSSPSHSNCPSLSRTTLTQRARRNNRSRPLCLARPFARARPCAPCFSTRRLHPPAPPRHGARHQDSRALPLGAQDRCVFSIDWFTRATGRLSLFAPLVRLSLAHQAIDLSPFPLPHPTGGGSFGDIYLGKQGGSAGIGSAREARAFFASATPGRRLRRPPLTRHPLSIPGSLSNHLPRTIHPLRRHQHPDQRGARHQAGVCCSVTCSERAARPLAITPTRAHPSPRHPPHHHRRPQESVRSRHPQLIYEAKLYKVLMGGVGIPNLRCVCCYLGQPVADNTPRPPPLLTPSPATHPPNPNPKKVVRRRGRLQRHGRRPPRP